ncbi:MAG: ABC transporter permease subunit [Chloroflexota bacterium]
MKLSPVQRPKGPAMAKESPFSKLIRVLLVLAFDVGAAWFLFNAWSQGYFQLVAIIAIIAAGMNSIFLLPRAYPYRWMALGLAFMFLFTIYPIIFTIYVAFTNYGDGHLLTKQQALAVIEKVQYIPESGKSYRWTAFQSDSGAYALWLTDPEGNTFLAKPGEEIVPAQPGDPGIGEADSKGVPKTVEGYERLNPLVAASDKELPSIRFGVEGGQVIQVRSPNEAAELSLRYQYDEAAGTIIDQSTGDVYRDVAGTFTTKDGKTLIPGYRAVIGTKNFVEFATSAALRGPLVRILTWNFVFPTVSVISTFALGLAIAIMFNDKNFPLKKLIRTFLLVPYTIPSLITILIWRGMFNSEFGIINRILLDWFGVAPRWTTEPLLAQFAILLVNLWLGFPYMMLITSGALQSIPTDLYEAATVDGANAWQKFRTITLPLLLVAVGPLLIASYIYNFNNFGLIYLFIGGGPPIVGAATQAGHTDILISYVYKLAFESGGRGVQYGYASAITIVLFIIIGALTMFQYRFTNMWEEVSENV